MKCIRKCVSNNFFLDFCTIIIYYGQILYRLVSKPCFVVDVNHYVVNCYIVYLADVIAMWLVVDVKPLFNIIVADVLATVAGGIANFWLFSVFHIHFDG